ncbi:Pentatricopeptide repeat-containing protein [Platanthera zijinensis]|uniref:Pentatricopeptide repeat-containing protein n=1 Tax=Platanthera zijinensis TaxID=2320716 RepID=A0AAP0AU34_9ASPA
MKSAWKSILPRISSQLPWIGSLQVSPSEPQIHNVVHSLANLRSVWYPERCFFSSEPAVEFKHRDIAFVSDIFSKPMESDEILTELESHNLLLDQDIAYSALRNLEGDPDSARRFFDFVSNRDNKALRSKSYNLMLRIVATKGDSGEFWDLVEIMKREGFGISKKTYLKVSENLESDCMGNDFGTRLKEAYLQNSDLHITTTIQILKEKNTPEEIHKSLMELNISLSSVFITSVLESIGSNPQKALIFFQWVRDQQLFNIDGTVYNAIAKVLGGEDHVKEFWAVLHQMRNAGHGMENRMYFTVMDRFHKRKMISAAVDLYEFAMADPGNPAAGDFLGLLKKIVVSKDLDLSLISRVVSIFINSGNKIKHSTFNSILESLTSVGRLVECGNILKSMEEGGFVADNSVHSQVIAGLCSVGRFDAACEYVKNLEKNGCAPNSKSWVSLVKNHALAGELDKAGYCFREMVEMKGCERDKGRAFHILVTKLCKKNRGMDAFEVLKEMVEKKNFRPRHCTYKFLIKKFVNRGSMKEAVCLLEWMREQEFSPFVEPFNTHMSKSGSVDDAMGFLKAMTDKKLPPTAIFLRLFRVLMESGRHEVANDVLSKSPGCVQKHAEILDIFDSLKTNEVVLA